MELANRIVAEFNIKPSDPERVIEQLSGGNQQKTILREVAATETTGTASTGADPRRRRGRTGRDRREDLGGDKLGAAVLVNSTDMPELARLCHRVLVLRDGHVAATLHDDSLTVPNLRHAIHKAKESA